MCGICGFISKGLNFKELAKELLLGIETRGRDATGIAFVDKKEITVAKEPGDATQFFKRNENTFKFGPIFLGHTRAATHGTACHNVNNHPVIGKQFILIHNGIVGSMAKIPDYPYLGEVDSEVLLSHIETHGLEKGLANISGSAAIAMLDKNANLYLFRHSSPIEVALFKDKNGNKQFVFASTETVISNAIQEIAPVNEFGFLEVGIGELEEDTLYKITPDLEISHTEIKLATTTYPSSYYHNEGYGD
jgi:glucosamine 6-phosphate synthetase-like amidotransferase/phosphosugar isomerase protein